MDWLPDLQDLIETARRDGALSLNLNGRALDSLPESLGNLTGLTELWVSGNQLSELPESLGNLTALRRLDLSGNRLTVLPDWPGRLPALTRLDLIGNPLTVLPGWLGNPAVGEHRPGGPLDARAGDAAAPVTGAADLDAILDRAPGGVTLTSEDGARLLHIILNGDRSGLVWEGDDEFLVSWGPVPPGAPPGQIARDAEDALDDPWFAADDEGYFGDITEDDARRAGHEFLRTGRRPANIQWLDKP